MNGHFLQLLLVSSWRSIVPKRERVTSFDSFLADVKQIQNKWQNIDSPGFEIPDTLLDAIWNDVNTKAKSIGLTTRFGPSPKSGLLTAEGMMRKAGMPESEIEDFRKMNDRYILAKSPEEFHRINK